MELRKINISELVPYSKNPRKNEKAIEAVIESIKQCTYISPIIIDEKREILAGHTRYEALKKLKYKSVPVIIKEGLSEQQKKKYRLLDNKTSELAGWDFELLEEELSGLDFEKLELDWGIDDFIFEEAEEREFHEDDFKEELPKETTVKYGDVYQLGKHRLMCGDSTKEADVLKLMNGEIADLFLTDPPYNVDYQGKTGEKLKIENDKMDNEEFRAFLITAFKQADRVLKKGGGFLYMAC